MNLRSPLSDLKIRAATVAAVLTAVLVAAVALHAPTAVAQSTIPANLTQPAADQGDRLRSEAVRLLHACLFRFGLLQQRLHRHLGRRWTAGRPWRPQSVPRCRPQFPAPLQLERAAGEPHGVSRRSKYPRHQSDGPDLEFHRPNDQRTRSRLRLLPTRLSGRVQSGEGHLRPGLPGRHDPTSGGGDVGDLQRVRPQPDQSRRRGLCHASAIDPRGPGRDPGSQSPSHHQPRLRCDLGPRSSRRPQSSAGRGVRASDPPVACDSGQCREKRRNAAPRRSSRRRARDHGDFQRPLRQPDEDQLPVAA